MDVVPMSAMATTDINGSGLADIIVAYRDCRNSYETCDGPIIQEIYLNTGLGFVPCNGDACPYAGVNLPGDLHFAQIPPLDDERYQIFHQADLARFVDIDGDGLPDIVRPGKCEIGLHNVVDVIKDGCGTPSWQRNLSRTPDLLEFASTNRGDWVAVDYESASSVSARQTGLARESSPPQGYQVVQEVLRGSHPIAIGDHPTRYEDVFGLLQSSLNEHPYERIEVKYRDFIRDSSTSETLGFEIVESTFFNGREDDGPNTVKVIEEYANEVDAVLADGSTVAVRHPLKGRLIERRIETEDIRIETQHSYALLPFAKTDEAVRIRSRSTVTSEWRADTSQAHGVRSGEWVESYDVLGYPLERVMGNIDLDGYFIADTEMVRERVLYNHLENIWRLGLAEGEEVYGYTKDIDGTEHPSVRLQYIERDHDHLGRVIEERRPNITPADCPTGIEDNDVITYTYGEFGLVERIQRGDSIATFEYESKKIHPSQKTVFVTSYGLDGHWGANISLSEQYEYQLETGEVVEATDANGHTFTTRRDSRGRATVEIGPDGNNLAIHTHAENYPPSTTTRIQIDTGLAFHRKTFFDGHGRTLASVEGAHSISDVRTHFAVYDGFGRLIREYLPEFIDVPST
ncbi:MAG: hypothetical protein ACNA8W_09755, partial [Bradymonadaceae bacterium]